MLEQWRREAPNLWLPTRREVIRVELDAECSNVFSLNRSEVEHVLTSFRTLRDVEVWEFGAYRTGRLVLDRHDALTGAIRRASIGGCMSPLVLPPGQGPWHPAEGATDAGTTVVGRPG